ncbi:MAG: polyphenol oxidase family protein [Bacteriovoracaceae bacterium]|nr:polyphenol oxidase family protein [Bacteriovoracaceae bacterium]
MSPFEYLLPTGRFITLTKQPRAQIIYNKQVHQNIIKNFEDSSATTEADGIYMLHSQRLLQPIAIKTADCLPIFIYGKKGLSFLHAGWKGLQTEIILNQINHDLEPETAIIGPYIHEDSFEVTGEFKDYFPKSPYFRQHKNKLTFNLGLEAARQLRLLNPHMNIIDSGICTYKYKNLHSFRRDKNQERNWNLYIPSYLKFDYT